MNIHEIRIAGGGVPDYEYFRDLFLAFAAFVGAGFGLPIPEEVAIVGAGLWTAAKIERYPYYRWLMLPVCILGVIIADTVLYTVGRRFGTRLLEKGWLRRFVPPEKRARIEANFHQYGVKILILGRLLPGIRTPLFITAGTMRLSVPRFLTADGIGAIIGNSLLFFLAYWFGDQFKELVDGVEGEVSRAKPLIFLILIVAVAVFLLVNFVRRPVSTGDPEELPLIGHQVAVHIDSNSSSGKHQEKRKEQAEADSKAKEQAKVETPAVSETPSVHP